MSKTLVVTGGAGFIGSNFVRFLNSHNPDWNLVVLDDLSSGLESNLSGSQCNFIRGSILDSGVLNKVTKGADTIVHLAAIGSVPRSIADPLPTHEANITGTFNVLQAARENGVAQVVVASSSSVYGSNPSIPRKESDWPRPISPYGVSKLATEAYANAYSYSYGMNTLAFRFFNVFGPYQRADHPYAAVVPKFISRAIAGLPVEVHGDGEQTRDFTYVDTVCQALQIACARQLHHQHPVNLALGSAISINELLRTIEVALGHSVSRVQKEPREGDIHASQADTNSLLELIPGLEGFGFSNGIQATTNWFLGSNEIS